jgi:polysaccharide biosynthesis/export protein
MVIRFLFLACLISVPVFSLSQESGKEKLCVADSKPAEAVLRAGTIYVVGDVRKPLGVPWKDTAPITVLQVLAMAGGTNPTASLIKARVIRKGENGTTEVPVNIKEMLAGKAPDVTLQADDILFVPSSARKGARKPQNEDLYDVPSSVPLHGPIYNR